MAITRLVRAIALLDTQPRVVQNVWQLGASYMNWLKDYGQWLIPIGGSVLGCVAGGGVMIGVYKNTVDGLEARVAKLEAQPRVIQPSVDPRLAECARLAKKAYGDGSVTVMGERTDILMLRLGCDAK